MPITTDTEARKLPTSAVNVTLLAFAAGGRAAAPLLLSAMQPCSNPSISPARRELSSKPAQQRSAACG